MIVLRYLQNRPSVGWDWFIQIDNKNRQTPINEFTTSAGKSKGLFTSTNDQNLSSAAVPHTKLRKQLQTSAKPCVFVNTHFHILCFHTSPYKYFSILIYLAALNIGGCFSPLSNQFSELRHPLKPSCLFAVLYLQHPWPLCFFYTSFLKSCLHNYSWVKLQYLAFITG